MSRQQRNIAIKNALVPRAPRLPADITLMAATAQLTTCPVKSADRRTREDHIADLIAEALETK